MNGLTLLARRLKNEEVINCLNSRVPELVEWGSEILVRKHSKGSRQFISDDSVGLSA